MSINLFGYYGETSVCMPRFYVTYGSSSWKYTLSIITLNFLSFLFIAVGYFFHLQTFLCNFSKFAKQQTQQPIHQNAEVHRSHHCNRLLLLDSDLRNGVCATRGILTPRRKTFPRKSFARKTFP